jgi:hypothetical protein
MTEPLSCERLDLNQDRALTVAGDVLMFRGRIGETCPAPLSPLQAGTPTAFLMSRMEQIPFVNLDDPAVQALYEREEACSWCWCIHHPFPPETLTADLVAQIAACRGAPPTWCPL